jgi:adenine-specific DNA methylase
MPDDARRLIEAAFPLRQTSLDSVHEKNIRHGHLSTLHIWPARRPLAACRAALLATLLPDPPQEEEREALVSKIGGKVTTEIKNGQERDVTAGGVLHWKREESPAFKELRERVLEANGGEPPVVMDPFAGGGAIPLEAMRLGCKVIAADLNPVAWFLLKATLEYPQRIAGEKRPVPDFAMASDEFLGHYIKATSRSISAKRLAAKIREVREGLFPLPDLGLDWHIRAWGQWVLDRARDDLTTFYPTVDRRMTVAYLWARTVPCKSCGVILPLLKTRWLAKKDKRRVLLTMESLGTRGGVGFGIRENVPKEGRGATLRENDKKLGKGTMSRAGATCPSCNNTMLPDELRVAAQAGRMGVVMTVVVTKGKDKKEYRLPTDEERQKAQQVVEQLDAVFAHLPFGVPDEPISEGGSRQGGGSPFTAPLYGLRSWKDLFSARQLLALGTFVRHTRAVPEVMRAAGYPDDWVEVVSGYLAVTLDKLADYCSNLCTWHTSGEKLSHVFVRYALPIAWDYCEVNPLSGLTGSYGAMLGWTAQYAAHGMRATAHAPKPEILHRSALIANTVRPDLILTDPPYYDAIPYAGLMDFFHVWLRRTTHGLSPEVDAAFANPLTPKWDHNSQDGELIDDASRFGGDAAASKLAYEGGMYRAFSACYGTLKDDGRLVVVFANKNPEAWETLVSALIRAGFTVTASWPIQTEMGNRTRAQASAALSASIWLVCRKRPAAAKPGWDNKVLQGMREKITDQLRAFWDANIRGADFVWAATGPALEAYSAHPYVRKAGSPGEVLTVREFLEAARRIVLDFAVAGVLAEEGAAPGDAAGLDNVTVYYLLHRKEFGHEDVPVGASILYAVSCNLSDVELADTYDLLRSGRGRSLAEELEDEDEEGEEASAAGSGATVRLKGWKQRTRKSLGSEVPGGRAVPMVDQVHRLLHLYRAGDVGLVDEYVRQHGLGRNRLFAQLVQALIHIAEDEGQSEEKALLEAIQRHLTASDITASAASAAAPTLFDESSR